MEGILFTETIFGILQTAQLLAQYKNERMYSLSILLDLHYLSILSSISVV